MIFMFFAFSAFAIGVTTITQAFFKFFERSRAFAEDMASVRTYLKGIKAPEQLQEAITSFLQLLHDRRRIAAKEVALFQNLPPRLVQRLKAAKFSVYLRKLPVIARVSESVMIQLCGIAEVRDLVPGDILCRRGSLAEAAWVLISGGLHVYYSNGTQRWNRESFEVVDEDCLEHSEFVESQRTVFAASCSEVLKISKTTFFKLARKSSVLALHLRHRAEARDFEEEWSDGVAVEADTPLLACSIGESPDRRKPENRAR